MPQIYCACRVCKQIVCIKKSYHFMEPQYSLEGFLPHIPAILRFWVFAEITLPDREIKHLIISLRYIILSSHYYMLLWSIFNYPNYHSYGCCRMLGGF